LDCEKQNEGDVDRKCICINDGTLLLRSKARRSKDRLINGLAELISDGEYIYGDFKQELVIKGSCSALVNMTLEAYKRYEHDLLASTFLERFVTLFYTMPKKEQRHYYACKEEMEEAAGATPIINPRSFRKIINIKKFKSALSVLADDFSALSLRSFQGCADQVEALACSHAILNDRFWLCEDDLDVVKIAREYLVDPASPNKSRIVQFHLQGKNQRDICLLLNMDYETYRPFVSRVIREAKLRGIG
jgi:hypothetical protein